MGDPSIDENIRVFIRQRPSLSSDGEKEVAPGDGIGGLRQLQQDGACSYFAAASKSTHQFKFDGCFDGAATQVDIYDRAAKPIVDSALLGYSGTIFAYGPTNSGKTFTMRGSPGSENKGIMPRCIEQLLQATRSSGGELWVSYLQIYCEIVSDLLNPAGVASTVNDITANAGPAGDALQLSIREKGGRVFVEGLSRAPITNMQDLVNVLARGDANRNTAETNMNATSSRSHAALMVSVLMPEETSSSSNNSGEKKGATVVYRESTLVLVDLAGSERAAASAGRQHMRLEEAKAINLSLSALGNCMSALAECRKHVPYRDSKLTRLLQGSLGGGARTSVMVNIAPGVDDTGEVLNALRFAARASKVKVVAKVSRFVDYESQYHDALRRLDEIEQQKAAWQLKKGGAELLLAKHEEEVEQLRDENASLKRQLQLLFSSSHAGGASGGGGSGTDANKAFGGAGGAGGAVSSSNSSSSSSSSSTDATALLPASASSADVLRRQMQVMAEKHLEDLNEAKAKHERKALLFRNQIADAQAEVSSLQTDLAAERERHLATVQELRRAGGKVEAVEKTLGARVQELVGELDEAHGKMEDLIDMVKAQTARADEIESRLLAARREQEGMVAKSQVTEMENLFMETVNRLSSRVIQLEKASKGEKAGTGRDDEAVGLPPAPNAGRIQPGGRILQNKFGR